MQAPEARRSPFRPVYLVFLIVGLGTLSLLAFFQEREKSRRVACLNNLRNLGLARQMVLHDHRIFNGDKGQTPFGEKEETPPPETFLEQIQLLFDRGILDDAEMLICPLSDLKPAIPGRDGRFVITQQNCSYVGPLWAADGDPSTPMIACRHPAGWCVLFLQGNVKWMPDREVERLYGKQPW